MAAAANKMFWHPLMVLITCVMILTPCGVSAAGMVNTDVRVIHASMATRQSDPDLEGLVGEMRSVFRYSSYRQLKRKRLRQEFGNAASISIPGGRTLELVPLREKGGRITYRLMIIRSGKTVFRTEVMLKKGKNLSIGGPKYREGVLIFNISGMYR